MAYVLAIDAGTTGVRAFALGDDGVPLGYAYREFPQHFPQPGWVEHDADDIWATTEAVCAEVQAAHGRPSAIGITNQRETVVAWSRSTGRPLARAIVWQDRRTAARCDELAAAGHLDVVRRRTGLVLDPYFSGTKLAWLLTDGGVPADADLAMGTVDSWLVWNLTGGAVHATEPSNASRTMLYDITERRWSAELCDLLGVPMAALPQVRPSVGDFGTDGDGVPIAGILGDQQSALFGQACLEPGMAKNTYGTGSFVLANVGPTCPEPVDGLLTTVAWELADGTVAYALEGAIFVTGAAVQWLRDGMGVIDDAAAVEALAASVPDSGGVVVVPAFTGLGSPWWDPYARGTVLGISRGSTAAHLARATLEAVAFQTRDVLDAMAAAGGLRLKALRVDGGASANGLLLQLVADQVQLPVTRPVVAETTALGAAYAAGLGAGVWAST
ncbi:MAG: glycerol kinase GlpK, partial [Acidimicrobiia bacterium]|nr:glycerol kinase GlpK [Acidimicrobiia bacterium]